MISKKCTKCSIEKNIEEFHKQNNGKYGVASICKLCKKEWRNLFYHNNGGKEQRKEKHIECKNKNPEKILYTNTKNRAKKKGLDFNLDIGDFKIPEYCPILGIKIISDMCISDNSPSLDRIDNNKGYIKGNTIMVSFRANRIKNNSSIDDIKKVRDYLKKIDKFLPESVKVDTEE